MNSFALPQIFDMLTYSKAESVFDMIMHYLGQDVFVRGIQIYLKRYLYGNTVRQDLWRALGEAAGEYGSCSSQLCTRFVPFTSRFSSKRDQRPSDPRIPRSP